MCAQNQRKQAVEEVLNISKHTNQSCHHLILQNESTDTLWLFNIAMENGPFIDDFPIKTSIYKGFSMAMLNNQMVIQWVLDIAFLWVFFRNKWEFASPGYAHTNVLMLLQREGRKSPCWCIRSRVFRPIASPLEIIRIDESIVHCLFLLYIHIIYILYYIYYIHILSYETYIYIYTYISLYMGKL